MINRNRKLDVTFWCGCLFILILDSKTCIQGASDGIQLCINVLIPTIFPFLVICPMLSSNICSLPSGLKLIGQLLRMPSGTEDLFLLGLLGGYPIGAANVSGSVRSGRITREDGRRMLAFCSNAGPSFLFGIGATLFPDIRYCIALWLIHIISAMTVGILTPGNASTSGTYKRSPMPLQKALWNAISTMATICGWVILFRIVITFAQRWVLWSLPSKVLWIILGVLELANGIVSLSSVQNIGQRMILFSGLLAFGGICVWMQTASVCEGVSTANYLPGKITQCAISVLLATVCQILLPLQQRHWPHPISLALCVITCIIYPIFLRNRENRCRNSHLVGV